MQWKNKPRKNVMRRQIKEKYEMLFSIDDLKEVLKTPLSTITPTP
ncbi:MAG: hypothetical protein QXK37_01210 [Candidatus Woesearchaeota archaeon]